MATKQKSPEQIAGALAREQFEAVADRFEMAWAEDGAFETLMDSLRAELSSPDRALSLEARCELADRIKAALPEDLRLAFWQFEEAKDIEQNLTQEAAYLVGLEIGRLMPDLPRLRRGVR